LKKVFASEVSFVQLLANYSPCVIEEKVYLSALETIRIHMPEIVAKYSR